MLPSSVPHHDGHHHVPVMSASTVTFSRPSIPAGSSQMRPSRPRLTLNTTINSSKPRSFGKGSSLSLNTLSAVSPTVKNTFVNAYQPAPETTTLVRPKLLIDPSVGQDQDFGTPSDQGSSRTPSNSSVSSASTASSEQTKIPYFQPKGVTSILLTSLTHRSYQFRMSSEAQSGLASKRVSFRDPIDEEIQTLRYVLAHSDIESVEPEYIAESPDSSDTTPTIPTQPEPLAPTQPEKPTVKFQVPSAPMSNTNLTSPPPPRKPSRGPLRLIPRRKSGSPPASTRMKRDSSSDEDSDGAIPQTPVAGRCKRRREWAWTLDPLQSQRDSPGVEKPEGSVASNDDDSVSTSSRFSESSTS
jgi:hypothetical protein